MCEPIEKHEPVADCDCPGCARIERDKLRTAVNALLHQIDIGDFVDSHGHSAKMLKATHDLMALMTPNASHKRPARDCGTKWGITTLEK